MKKIYDFIHELKSFIILWSSQAFSALGSSMTSMALIIWSYQQEGSALSTALLSVCSYAPYIIMSIFAGAFSDKWNKKLTMLVSDSIAALCTIAVLILLKTESLQLWHLYCINAVNGLMNSVQRPASDVAVSLLTPKKYYQAVSGMRSFSNSLVNLLTPAIAAAVLSFAGIDVIIYFDLITFAAAFIALAFFVKMPEVSNEHIEKESVLCSARQGLSYLKKNRGILDLILFLAVINLIASIYEAALPAMLLSREGGGKTAYGIVHTAVGVATLVGSVIASAMPAPKSRVRVIFNSLLISMSTENFIIAFGKNVPMWCIGAVLGWLFIPLMGANMDVLFRSRIPVTMQGRVYAARNTLQFFTIPIGYFIGGLLVDKVFEPFMAAQSQGSLITSIFGSGKGSGAAVLFFIIGIAGIIPCLIFRWDWHIWALEDSSVKK